MLNDDEKAVLSRTWADVLPRSEAFADLFFERLLALRPTFAALFLSSDLRARKAEVVVAVSFLVRSLDWPESEWIEAVPLEKDAIFSTFALVESSHSLVGLDPDTFPLLGEALLWALENTLGARFDHTARGVWARVASSIVTAMKLGAVRAEDGAVTRRQLVSAIEPASDTERYPLNYPEGGPPSVEASRRTISN